MTSIASSTRYSSTCYFPFHISQISDYIKSTVHSANALVGTCKMGTESDKMGVVDSALKVRQLIYSLVVRPFCILNAERYY